MRILVFLHGTTIMHAAGVGRSRVERVRQVRETDPTVGDFAAYVPIGDAVATLTRWTRRGAEITYLSAHRTRRNVEADESVLRRHGFPPGPVFAREPGESYADVVGRATPDLIVEDDCESIGGTPKMTHPQLPDEVRRTVASVVVAEFDGIDGVADTVLAMLDRS